jgi:hypothetical protein
MTRARHGDERRNCRMEKGQWREPISLAEAYAVLGVVVGASRADVRRRIGLARAASIALWRRCKSKLGAGCAMNARFREGGAW